jgi:hypothetical protein
MRSLSSAVFAVSLLEASAPAIVVTDTAELIAAINAANNGGGHTILLQNGIYNVTATLVITAADVTIRGLSGDRTAMSIFGPGMNRSVAVRRRRHRAREPQQRRGGEQHRAAEQLPECHRVPLHRHAGRLGSQRAVACAAGFARWSFGIPAVPVLMGTITFHQAFSLEPGTRSRGLIASRAGESHMDG